MESLIRMGRALDKLKKILHPYQVIERIRWGYVSKKFKRFGKNSIMAYNFTVIGPEYIELGDRVTFGHDSIIACYDKHYEEPTGYIPRIKIGDNIYFGRHCSLSCINEIIILDNVLFGDNVSVFDNFHGKSDYSDLDIPPNLRELSSKGPVFIGKNIWIGKNVCIMPNVKIGDYAIIGANAVVTHDIPAYAVAAGVPARVIKILKK